MTKKSEFSSQMRQLEDVFDQYLNKKAPAIPTAGKEALVKFAPYLAILSVILMIPTILAVLGLGTLLAPLGLIGGTMTGRPFLGFGYLIGVVFSIVILVLTILSINPLFKRERKGWQYMYYATLLGGVNNLLHLDLVGLIIFTGLWLYVLFQVREYYK
jgi:uncharacterized Tic20 family protein